MKPVIHAPPRVPLALRVKLQDERRRLTELNIIAQVTEPTPSVSSLVVVQHGSKLRVCIDPKHLTEAVQRSHYSLPTLDVVLSHLRKAKVYSVLDARNFQYPVLSFLLASDVILYQIKSGGIPATARPDT